MYKEALIRNTYQGILANRPRDLTEEELEALELEQLQISKQLNEVDIESTTGSRVGARTPTKDEAGEQQAPAAILHVGLGLPPLSRHCPDSPMSAKAHQSTSTNWRHTVCGNVSSPQTQQRSQLLYTPVSMATGGETMTDRVSFTNNTEAGSVMSWIQDDEDAFYEQLAEEETTKSPAKTRPKCAMVRKHSEEDEECIDPEEERSHSYHSRASAQPRKGGRAGKKKSSNGQWKDVKKGGASTTNSTPSKGGNGSSKPNGTNNVPLSGGRFDALRR